jgi:N-acetylglucosaminyltransferase
MEVGDDRVLTNELLRAGWRTVYQPTASVYTDTPGTWRAFVRQQVRWARSSQRETFLSLPWLWRHPFTLACFVHDIITPFWIYALMGLTVAHIVGGTHTIAIEIPLWAQICIAYLSATLSLGLRQIPHFRRFPRDRVRLPLFILRVTFLMPVLRITGFATMFHQSWRTRGKWVDARDPATESAAALHLAPAEGPAAR